MFKIQIASARGMYNAAVCNATVNYFETGTNVQSAKFMSITTVSCHAITIHSQLRIFRGSVIIEWL